MRPRRLWHAGGLVMLALALLPLPGVLAAAMSTRPAKSSPARCQETPGALPEPGQVWPRRVH